MFQKLVFRSGISQVSQKLTCDQIGENLYIHDMFGTWRTNPSNTTLMRQFRQENPKDSLRFMNMVYQLSEQFEHYPHFTRVNDITQIELTTNGGISLQDVFLAYAIENLKHDNTLSVEKLQESWNKDYCKTPQEIVPQL